MHRIICVLLLVPCLVAVPNSATADWAAVQSLAAGERIQVHLFNGKILDGRINRVTSDAVFVERRSQTTEVPRQDVSRVYRQKPGSGGKWAIIGALIGAGAGGAGGAATMEKEMGYGGAVAGSVALGGLLGAGTGYLLKHGKSVLVYQASSQKR
jgi:sRNA-binding regulator protein Hfq